MSIGFDPHNLTSAVSLVMALAAGKKQSRMMWNGTAKEFVDLTDADDVQAYLMLRAEQAYSDASAVVTGLISGVVYASVGFVFEEHPDEMYPPAISSATEQPEHLVMFWQLVGVKAGV